MYRLVLVLALLQALAATSAVAQSRTWRDCAAGNPARSIKACSRLIKARRGTRARLAKAYAARANAFGRTARLDLAFADFDKAIKLDPKNADTYYGRGTAYAKTGQHDNAFRDYEAAIRRNPRHAFAYNGRAWAYLVRGDAERALPDANRSLELNPRFANAFFTRGQVFEVLGHSFAAIADYRKALQLDPASSTYKEGLARLQATH